MRRSALLAVPVLLPTLLLAACGGGDGASPAPAAENAPAAAAAPAEAPAASSGVKPGKWSGAVTGGYKGNRISFVVADGGASVGDVVFEGHWDCSDGIETTTSGPTGSFPLQGSTLAIESVDPPGGGATATRFVLNGQIRADGAEGTLRINLNALGCDTRQLSWTAAPAQ